MHINEQRVREFAYQIWESEGRPVGHSDRHWEMASKLAASDVPTSPNEPAEPISPGEPAHPVSPSEPIQPTDPQPEQPQAQAQAVSPPRKSRAKVASASAKSLIDTQPVSIGIPSDTKAKSTTAKKPAKAKKPKITENESM